MKISTFIVNNIKEEMSYKNSLLVRVVRKIKRILFPPFTPEKIRANKLKKDYEYLISCGVDTQPGYVELFGHPIIYVAPNAHIRMGKGVVIISDSQYNHSGINHPAILSAEVPGAEIILEDGVGLSGSSIVAVQQIHIGANTMLGANTNIYETDFHPSDSTLRKNQKSILEAPHAPIHIGKNCWLASNVTVLKGVTIGDDVVVGAMSLVNKNIPDKCIAAGIPANVIKMNS